MPSAQSVSILLVLPGTFFMLASLALCTGMRKGVPDVLRAKWSAMTYLILFFMAGYIAFLLIQLRNIKFPLEVLTSSVFFGGSIFVFLVMRLTSVTIRNIEEGEEKLSEVNKTLIAKNAELETEIAARLRAEHAAQSGLQRLSMLHAMDLMITSTLDLKVTMTLFLEQLISRLQVDAAAILLLNPYTQTLEYGADRGFTTRTIQETKIRLGTGPAGTAAKEQRLIQSEDLGKADTDDSRTFLVAEENFHGYCAIPLLAKGQVKGVLETFQHGHGVYEPELLEFFQALAVQAAIAIDNATLFKELQTSNSELIIAYDSTIEGWGHALELRDKETEGHTQRVTEMTIRVARIYGLSEKEIVHIRRGALLHDIGKMGIPDSILLKDGPLTPEEEKIMHHHPVYAFEMLSPIAYLRPALDIPYCHHEKWDGTGYPRKLKGKQIPLAARIFALADNWDALISQRRYHQAWPREHVVAFIRSRSGSHFDPDLVELFIANS
ncbi:MAG: HD domain-containing phosphohydrolase [Desulfobulbaceae bacterium]